MARGQMAPHSPLTRVGCERSEGSSEKDFPPARQPGAGADHGAAAHAMVMGVAIAISSRRRRGPNS